MSLNSIIRTAVSTVNSVTASLQGTVLHSAWIGQDAMGAAVYGRRLNGLDIYGSYNATGVAIGRQAVIEQKQRIREIQGRTVLTFAHLVFVGPIEPNTMSALRKEPVDPRDIFVLPDGTTGPVVDVVGVMDSDTSNLYVVEVWLGDTLRIGGQ
jgi:hypothetical protein